MLSFKPNRSGTQKSYFLVARIATLAILVGTIFFLTNCSSQNARGPSINVKVLLPGDKALAANEVRLLNKDFSEVMLSTENFLADLPRDMQTSLLIKGGAWEDQRRMFLFTNLAAYPANDDDAEIRRWKSQLQAEIGKVRREVEKHTVSVASTDSNGAAKFAEVPPGKYYVFTYKVQPSEKIAALWSVEANVQMGSIDVKLDESNGLVMK